MIVALLVACSEFWILTTLIIAGAFNNHNLIVIMVYFSLLLQLLLITKSWAFLKTSTPSSIGNFINGALHRPLHAKESPTSDDENKKKSTKFDRVIDDFIGKRYGAGEAFYGKRMSDLDEDAYSEIQNRNKPRSFSNNPPKENAIAIYGSLDSIGQFLVYELNEKGFNIRLLTDNVKGAINMFGLPGNNVDIIELKLESPLESYTKAVEGAQAVIFSGNFDPVMNLLIGSCRKYNQIAIKLLEIMRQTKQNTKGTSIQKIVHVSRYSEAVGMKLQNPFDLFENAESGLFSTFRSLAFDLEEAVRDSSFEYVVVRAPGLVEVSREGSRRDLIVTQQLQSSSFTEESTSSAEIGILDLAECVSQALLLDVSGVTFQVREESRGQVEVDQPLISSKAMDLEFGVSPKREIVSRRVVRRAYYSILDMDDADMRSSYMIKPQEAYVAQLEEDTLVEKYWASMFKTLRKDTLR